MLTQRQDARVEVGEFFIRRLSCSTRIVSAMQSTVWSRARLFASLNQMKHQSNLQGTTTINKDKEMIACMYPPPISVSLALNLRLVSNVALDWLLAGYSAFLDTSGLLPNRSSMHTISPRVIRTAPWGYMQIPCYRPDFGMPENLTILPV